MLVGTLEAPLLQQQVGSREQQQQCAPGDAQQHSRQLTMSSCYRVTLSHTTHTPLLTCTPLSLLTSSWHKIHD
jgi:hypothetical protein